MGNARYSTELRDTRSEAMGYKTKARHEIFTQREVHNKMSPHGVTVREARDSEANPFSLPIILGLDVTGSMGSVPHQLVKDGLPTLMGTLVQKGVFDPALMFMAIGDHEVDDAPLQIGQFESGDEELDNWLTQTWLEGGGGGNKGESYMLAWYFAAHHTATDHWDKRGEKGFLFTVGDEPVLDTLHGRAIKNIMGTGQASDISSAELLDQARERWNVYHLHITETASGRRPDRVAGWRQLMGDNLVEVQHHSDLPNIIAQILIDNQATPDKPSPKPSEKKDAGEDESSTEILL